MSKEKEASELLGKVPEANSNMNKLDKDTIKIEFIGEFLVNDSLTVDQLVDGYKAEGLTRSFIIEIINEMLSDECIELIPGFTKQYRFPSIKKGFE